MKYNLNQVLLAFDGREISDTTSGVTIPATLRSALVRACTDHNPQIHSSGDEKFKIYRLLQRVYAEGESTEIFSDEVSLLKTLVAEVFPVAILGPVYDLLEKVNDPA